MPVALLNSSDNVVSTTTTFTGGPGNIPGYYTFTNLISGTYYVSFTVPAGYIATIANSGNDAMDSDGLPEGNAAVTGNYVLNAGQSIPDGGPGPVAAGQPGRLCLAGCRTGNGQQMTATRGSRGAGSAC